MYGEGLACLVTITIYLYTYTYISINSQARQGEGSPVAERHGRQSGGAGLPHQPRGQGGDQREEVRSQHLDPLVRLRKQQPMGLHWHFRPDIRKDYNDHDG